MRTSSLRRVAATAAAALMLTAGWVVGLAIPAAANHTAMIAVSQAGAEGAHVTVQVDVTFTTSNSGQGVFTWSTGDGRNGSVADGVSNGVYAGNASGSGTLSGGTGTVLGRFTWTRTSPAANVARTRITYAYADAGAYTVNWSDCCPTQSGSLPVSSQAGLMECGNGLDDDGDGLVDLTDPLCEDSEDDTEAADCPPFGPVVVCLNSTGTPVPGLPPVVVQTYDVSLTPGPTVIGYLDTYRFTVAGVGLNVPCVTVVPEPVRHPCETAGGTRVNRIELHRQETFVPTITPGTIITSFRVCHAELAATVLDFGVTSAPAYTFCEAGQVSL